MIFVISLPSRSDRRDSIALAAANTNLEFEFRDGIEGSRVSDKSSPQDAEYQVPKDAEVGWWRAHMDVVQE